MSSEEIKGPPDPADALMAGVVVVLRLLIDRVPEEGRNELRAEIEASLLRLSSLVGISQTPAARRGVRSIRELRKGLALGLDQ